MPYKVTQYEFGYPIRSKTYRFKLWAKWVAFLAKGESPMGFHVYTSSVKRVN